MATSLLVEAPVNGKLRLPWGVARPAGVLVSMLAHVGSHRYGFEFWGIRTASLVDSLTGILHWTVTGRAPRST